MAHRLDGHPVARWCSHLPIIDNFSRRILAWRLAARLEPQTTCQLLTEAARNLPAEAGSATVVADSGLENVNGEVDSLFGLGQLRRVLAQVEVTFSNSMIGAWWRSLKHGWLYLPARLESNRQLSYGACRPPVRNPSGLPDPSASSRVLQVHDEMSGMS